ncbi:MAG: hypothetical protein K8S18_02865 [Desulfobacula sp.]|nr:hypothetical protein [Desulfobacula sp.]
MKIDDIKREGVSLYDLLKHFKMFIDEVNEIEPETYNFKEVEEFFNGLCSESIDNFAQYVNIYKDQIIDDEYKNHYNLEREIEKFKEISFLENEIHVIEQDIHQLKTKTKEFEEAYTKYSKDIEKLLNKETELFEQYELLEDKIVNIQTTDNKGNKSIFKEIEKEKELLYEKNEIFEKQNKLLKHTKRELDKKEIIDDQLIDAKLKRIDILRKKIEENIKLCNSVSIYNTNNAAFLSFFLIYHFEFTSFVIANPSGCNKCNISYKPLLFAVDKLVKREAKTVKDFEFYNIIENVFNETEKQVTSIIEFYINKLIYVSDVEDFLVNPMFSVFGKSKKHKKTGVFQFRMMISKHIRYLNFFRVIILKNIVTNYSQSELQMCDKYFLSKIEDYCTLYIKGYQDINRVMPIRRTDTDVQHPLYLACNQFFNIRWLIKKMRTSKIIDAREINEILSERYHEIPKNRRTC